MTTATCVVNGQQLKYAASADNPGTLIPLLVTLAMENPGKDIVVTFRVDPD